jgi:hypothetical protein
MKAIMSITVMILFYVTSIAYAGFSSGHVTTSPATIKDIFLGSGKIIYIQFNEPNLPGCYLSMGGYITSSWPDANNGVYDDVASNRILATLLFSKANNVAMDVYYRINDSGNGWSECAIDNIYIH